MRTHFDGGTPNHPLQQTSAAKMVSRAMTVPQAVGAAKLYRSATQALKRKKRRVLFVEHGNRHYYGEMVMWISFGIASVVLISMVLVLRSRRRRAQKEYERLRSTPTNRVLRG